MSDEFIISEEVAEWLGLKKSEFLSELIVKQQEDDFGFEDFQRFDSLVPGTIETPDKAFEHQGDQYAIRTYVKTYNVPEFLHQVVIGAIIESKDGAEVFLPILIFVTRQADLVMNFERGETINSKLLN